MEKEIINKVIEDYNLDLGEDYTYVCASIIKRSSFPSYTEILFCEDDFVDPNGIPYIMQANVEKDSFSRDRMLVFYTKDKRRFLIPMDDNNWKLIGNEIPSNVANIDYGKATKIFHRKTLEINPEPIKLQDGELDELVKKYIKLYRKGRMLFAGILSSFVWFILVALPVIFLVADLDDNMNLGMAILISGFVIFVVGSIFIIRFFLKFPAKRLRSLAYKSEFLVVDFYKDVNIKGLDESHITGYTYEDGMCKMLTYGVSHYDYPLVSDVKYFDVIYRYSAKPNPRNLDFCFFMKKM